MQAYGIGCSKVDWTFIVFVFGSCSANAERQTKEALDYEGMQVTDVHPHRFSNILNYKNYTYIT